jgi:hypothetical protein
MNSKRLSELRYKGYITDSEYKELKLALKALEKDKCSSCKHYDKDYGETCLNPEGTCRVFAYDGYEKGDRE